MAQTFLFPRQPHPQSVRITLTVNEPWTLMEHICRLSALPMRILAWSSLSQSQACGPPKKALPWSSTWIWPPTKGLPSLPCLKGHNLWPIQVIWQLWCQLMQVSKLNSQLKYQSSAAFTRGYYFLLLRYQHRVVPSQQSSCQVLRPSKQESQSTRR